MEASIGSRAERKSGSGAAAEDGGAGADLQRQSTEGATGGADRARAMGGRLEQRAAAKAETNGRTTGAEEDGQRS